MKYQFILNGKVVSALILARYQVDFFLKEDDGEYEVIGNINENKEMLE